MPRNYKRKTTRSTWTEESLHRALKAISEKKCSIRKAAQMYDVPYGTIQDRIRKRYPEKKVKLGRKTIFTEAQEMDLASFVLKLANLYYGLTPKRIRQLVYDFAISNNIKHNFNCQSKMCGKEWLYGFLRRHPQISLRRPEATSLNRVLAFNRTEVNTFYDNLEQVMEKHNFGPTRIFNVDETGISGVHKPCRVLAQKGRKQVGAITSGERGQTTTVVCSMSAAGQHVPPMFIFKRERMKEGLDRNGPVGAIYRCSSSGWITEDLFLEWLNHFANFAKVSKENTALLVLDNHCTHSCLKSYTFCRDNGIVIVSLPPHTSHRLQPLDVTFFSSLKSAYYQECDQYMKSNHYEKISLTCIAELFAKAFNRMATIEKGVKGFQVTGIYPLNRNVFGEEEFTRTPLEDITPEEVNAPAEGLVVASTSGLVSNQVIGGPRKKSNAPAEVLVVPSTSGLVSNQIIGGPKKKSRRTRLSSSSSSDANLELVEISHPDETDDEDKTIEIDSKSFEDIHPIPNNKTLRSVKRKQKSKILTSTPLKEELEEKEQRKMKRNVLVVKKKILSENPAKEKKSKSNKAEKLTSIEKEDGLGSVVGESQNPKKEKKCKSKEGDKLPQVEKIEDNVCPVCDDYGKNEIWWRCRTCGIWCHSTCTEFDRPEDFNKCVKCESDSF